MTDELGDSFDDFSRDTDRRVIAPSVGVIAARARRRRRLQVASISAVPVLLIGGSAAAIGISRSGDRNSTGPVGVSATQSAATPATLPTPSASRTSTKVATSPPAPTPSLPPSSSVVPSSLGVAVTPSVPAQSASAAVPTTPATRSTPPTTASSPVSAPPGPSAPQIVVAPEDLPKTGDMGPVWYLAGRRFNLRAPIPLSYSYFLNCQRGSGQLIDPAASGFQQMFDQGLDSGLVANEHVEVAASDTAAAADFALLTTWMGKCTGGFENGLALDIPKVGTVSGFGGGAVYFHRSGGLPQIVAIGRSRRGIVTIDVRTQGVFSDENVGEVKVALRRALERLDAAHL